MTRWRCGYRIPDADAAAVAAGVPVEGSAEVDQLLRHCRRKVGCHRMKPMTIAG